MKMKELRIAIVDHVGIKGGMECYDLDLASALKRASCDARVYSNFDSKTELTRRSFNFRLRENYFSMLGLVLDYAKLAFALKKDAIDVCILHGFRMGILDWIFMRLIGGGRKIILIVHDPESLIGLNAASRWRNRMYDRANSLVVHNQFSKEALIKNIPEKIKSKVALIVHGHSISAVSRPDGMEAFMRRNSMKQTQKHILFFGQIKETKGLDILMKAFAKTDRSACLVMAGRLRRHTFEPYQQLIDEYGLNSQVKLFTGYVTPENRNLLFHMADVVVLPYRKVYQSGVMLMAMSYGKAVIASDLPPNREMINDKLNGYLFKSGDETDLARRLTEVLHDDSGRKAVAENGLKHVREKYNWDNIAAEWIKLIQS